MLSFTPRLSQNSNAFAVFVNEKSDFKDTRGILPKDASKKINLFIKSLKAKNQKNEISSLDISDKKKCFIISIKNKYENSYFEEIGGSFFTYIKNYQTVSLIDICADGINTNKDKLPKLFSEFIFGFNLKSYTFNKYKTINKEKLNKKINFKIISSFKEKIKREYKYYDAIKEGVFLSRDLVSEPPNVLNPKRYTEEIKKLTKLGLSVEIFNEAKLKKLGMNSLLGVGQGSENETYLVIIKWNGAKSNFGKPLAFVGKGVCFDTGGISLKPAKFM